MSTLDERVTNLEQRIQNIINEWQVNERLTIGEVDPKVVIESGKVDGRDVSEDGIVLDNNTTTLGEHATRLDNHDTKLGEHHTKIQYHDTKLGEHHTKLGEHQSNITTLKAHSNNRNNPHGVTYAQSGASKAGGESDKDFKSRNLTATTIKATKQLLLGEIQVNIGKVNDQDATFTDSLNIVGGNLFFANDSSGWIGATNKIEDDLDGPGKSWLHIKGIETGSGPQKRRRIAIYGRTVIRDHKGLSVYGPFYQGSTKELKKNISQFKSEYAKKKLIKELNPKKFVFKDDPEEEEHLGFIAEEVPDIFSDKDHKTVKIMDIVAALVKVVQEQQKKIENIERRQKPIKSY